MMRKPSQRRKFLIAAGGGLGVFLLLALVVPNFINWNRYKPEIEGLASAVTARAVHVDGPIAFKLLPLPSLTATNVRVGNLPGGTAPEMATIALLDVRVAILPLFFGEFAVSKVILEKPVIRLEVLPDGRQNWRLGKQKKKYLEKTADKTPNLKLDHFAVMDGVISYRDAADQSYDELSGVTLDLAAKSYDGPFKVKGQATYRAVPIAFDLALSRKGIGGKTPFKGTIGFAAATLDTSGIVTLGETPAYEGNATIASSDVGETVTALQMLAGATEVSGLALAEPMQATFRLAASEARIETRGLALTLGGSKGTGQLLFALGEQPRADIALNFSTIDSDVFLQALPPRDAKAPLTLADIFEALDPGNMVGELALSADVIRQGKQAIRQAEVKVSAVDGKVIVKKFHALLPGGSDVDVAGVLTSGETPRFDGRIVTASNNLRALLDWMDVEIKGVPPGRLTAFAIVSDLAVDQSRYRFSDATFRLDDMTARGEVTYAPGLAPAIGVTARADRLSLGNYLAPGRDCVGGGDAKDRDRALDRTLAPKDVFDIGDLTLTLKLTVDQFSCRPVTGRAVVIDARLTGGTFELSTFRAQDLLGLAVDGKGRIADISGKPRFDFQVTAAGPSLAGLGAAFPDLLPVKAGEAAGRVTLKGGLDGTFEDLRLRVDGQAGATAIKADADLGFAKGRGLQGMAATVTARGASFAAFANQWDFGLAPPLPADDRPFSLTAAYKGTPQNADISVKGTLATATVTMAGATRKVRDARASEIAFTIKGSDARAFVRGLGFDFGKDAKAMGPIQLAGALTSDPRTITLESLTGQFGPVQLTGGLAIGRGGERPRITGDIKAGAIDLDRLLGAAPPASSTGSEWSREPYHLDLLQRFDTDLRLSADSIATRGYLFEQPRLRLVIGDGRMQIKDMTGGLFGGTVALNFVFGPQGPGGIPGMGLGLALKNASLQQALETAAKVSAVSGTLNLQGTFSGAGASPHDLVRTITGQAAVTFGPGIVKGVDLPALSGKLKTVADVPTLGDVIAVALAGGETAHQGMNGVITARNGVLSLADTAVAMTAGQANLAMTVDLPAWSVWSTGRFQLTEHPKLPPIGITIAGSLGAPQIKYQTRDLQVYMAKQLGRTVIERAVEQGSLKQGVKGLLKGTPPAAKPAVEGAPETPAAPQAAPPAARKEQPAQDPAKALFKGILKSLEKKAQPESPQP